MTYTQNGSYPSCSPHIVKYLSVSTLCPKFNLTFWPVANVKAGT